MPLSFISEKLLDTMNTLPMTRKGHQINASHPQIYFPPGSPSITSSISLSFAKSFSLFLLFPAPPRPWKEGYRVEVVDMPSGSSDPDRPYSLESQRVMGRESVILQCNSPEYIPPN